MFDAILVDGAIFLKASLHGVKKSGGGLGGRSPPICKHRYHGFWVFENQPAWRQKKSGGGLRVLGLGVYGSSIVGGWDGVRGFRAVVQMSLPCKAPSCRIMLKSADWLKCSGRRLSQKKLQHKTS